MFCIHFLLAAVATYHKLGGLEQYKFITLQFWRSEVQNGLKLRCRQACGASAGSKGECIPAFPSF